MATNKASAARTRAFIKSFVRSYLSGACFNPRGYHSIGVVYAIYPGLASIHKDPKELKNACRRYIKHFNTHPFWVPCMIGILLSAEMMISRGQLPPAMLEKVKDTTSYTLSAIGDSVFAGSLLIFWALSTICLLLAGFRFLPLGLGISLFACLQLFRLLTFWGGVRHGLSFLGMLKRWDLINWGQRIKLVNALLLICLWFLAWPGKVLWSDWLVLAGGMAVCAKLLARRKLMREVVLIGFILALAALPWLDRWIGQLMDVLTG
ncbi:MAG: PTS system mannose/fructose/sorbose family transporter subunit IID [Proteobacteria bacterium]|nr:PTS system mannose/fructose/sorbose family transporter subunit IID [Pseudomonadota bacterium]